MAVTSPTSPISAKRVSANIADIRGGYALRHLLGGQDFLFNPAAQTSHIDSMPALEDDLAINCTAQLQLLEACRAVNPDLPSCMPGRVKPGDHHPSSFRRRPATDSPHKRPTVAVRLPRQFALFLSDFDGMERGSLAGSLLVLGRHANAGPNILGDNSRLGEFNSRLGGREFPVSTAAGICSQGCDLPHYFFSQTAVIRGKSKKFPVSTGKTGNIASSAERAAASLSRQQSRPSASLSAG
jgi:hypothetical protein